MHPNMISQILPSEERHPARFTFIILFTRMYNHVPFQRLLVAEPLQTHIALLIALLQMHRARVTYQMVFQIKAPTARLAFVHPRRLLMHVLQVNSPSVVRVESLRAHRAPTRELLQMHTAHVK